MKVGKGRPHSMLLSRTARMPSARSTIGTLHVPLPAHRAHDANMTIASCRLRSNGTSRHHAI
ncbi:hypothetical protein C7S15_4146 [Burkholderia cepacia]|nr:hypothetical protein [Burkholderia cepacia]